MPATFAIDAAGLTWSPYNWLKSGSTFMQAINPGAYLRFGFSGTSAKLNLEALVGGTAILGASVDNSPWAFTTLNNVAQVTIATGLAAGTHDAWVYLENTQGPWAAPTTYLKVLSVELDTAAVLSTSPLVQTGRMLLYGDSILAGHHVDPNNIPGQDPMWTMAPELGRAFGCEWGLVAISSVGWTVVGFQSFPAVFVPGDDTNSSWNKYWSGQSRLTGGLLSPAPDHIFVNLGTNDRLIADGTVTASISGWLSAVRAAAPNASIWVMIPSWDVKRAAILASIAAASSDLKIRAVDLGAQGSAGLNNPNTGGATRQASDGVHPFGITHGYLAALAIEQMQAAIDVDTLLVGLEAAYHLEETGAATRIDATGRGNSLPAINAPGSGAGKINTAALFVRGSNQKLRLDNVADLSSPAGFWWSGWLNLNSKPVGNQFFLNLSDNAGSSSVAAFYSTTGPGFKCNFADTSLTTHGIQDTGFDPSIGQWNFVNLWWDPIAGTGNIKVNDRPTLSVSMGGLALRQLVLPSLTFGALTVSDAASWDGLMDEGLVYTRTPSSTELARLYAAGTGLAYPFTPVIPSPGLQPYPFWATMLFQQRCDLYRPLSATHAGDGRSKPPTAYTVAYTNVPCYFTPTDNVDEEATGLGRAKGWNLLTIDGIWLPLGQEIGDNWVVVDRTLNLDGTHTATWGETYTTQGDPRIFNGIPGVPCGHIQERIFTTTAVPDGVLV